MEKESKREQKDEYKEFISRIYLDFKASCKCNCLCHKGGFYTDIMFKLKRWIYGEYGLPLCKDCSHYSFNMFSDLCEKLKNKN